MSQQTQESRDQRTETGQGSCFCTLRGPSALISVPNFKTSGVGRKRTDNMAFLGVLPWGVRARTGSQCLSPSALPVSLAREPAPGRGLLCPSPSGLVASRLQSPALPRPPASPASRLPRGPARALARAHTRSLSLSLADRFMVSPEPPIGRALTALDLTPRLIG